MSDTPTQPTAEEIAQFPEAPTAIPAVEDQTVETEEKTDAPA